MDRQQTIVVTTTYNYSSNDIHNGKNCKQIDLLYHCTFNNRMLKHHMLTQAIMPKRLNFINMYCTMQCRNARDIATLTTCTAWYHDFNAMYCQFFKSLDFPVCTAVDYPSLRLICQSAINIIIFVNFKLGESGLLSFAHVTTYTCVVKFMYEISYDFTRVTQYYMCKLDYLNLLSSTCS